MGARLWVRPTAQWRQGAARLGLATNAPRSRRRNRRSLSAPKPKRPPVRRAFVSLQSLGKNLERAKGLEPSTPTLARSCSTTELHPHPLLTAIARRQRRTYAKCAP